MTDFNSWQQGPPFPWWWNSWWLGPVQIPPLPPWVGMQDRVTGTTWWLTLSTDQHHLQLTDQAPVGPQRAFGPFDGPFIGQYGFRLGVSNGHLVFDQYPDQGAGPFARTPSNNQAIAGLLLVALATPSTFDHLAFIVGSATNSIFSSPHPFIVGEPAGGSDVLSP